MSWDSIGTWIGTTLSAIGAFISIYQGYKSKSAKAEILQIESTINEKVSEAKSLIQKHINDIYTADQVGSISLEIANILKLINKFTCEKREVKGSRHKNLIEELGNFLVKLKSSASIFEINLDLYENVCNDIDEAINTLSNTSDPAAFREKSGRLQSVISSLLSIVRKNHRETHTLGEKNG